ncbi:glycogenin-2 isoform X1 [Folsomia candida]|uniref:glycogenin glucosyltransferase n=1 Tax=Folsomia candida TaxID=158441 RepID=A0A226DLP0_FOLCA|nr:glycogenin-2 isoform X1 [Folsomia candida]OXA46465.1 Glycogenin-2 [Folsomia candida]
MPGEDEAWVTLATNDSYALGTLVVSRSLKRVNTTRKLVVMVTSGVSVPMRKALSSEFDVVYDVNIIDSQDAANLALLTRPELGITFTKLHCWKLVQFSKCVFLDADTLILQNCDELFDRSEFSASPDVGWPDCFNSGVFVFKPSIETFDKLLAFAIARGSFDGGDQGLLNLYFNDWSVSDISRHLPFIYNMVASAAYTYLPAFKMFGANVKIVHFIGPEKPWLMYFDSSTGMVRAPSGQEHLFELLQSWWNIFRTDVHNKLSPEMGGGGHQSATEAEAEQVQDPFLYVHTPTANASSEPSSFSLQIHESSYHPPPAVVQSDQSQSQPPIFHWTSVAIERFAPETTTPVITAPSIRSSSPPPPMIFNLESNSALEEPSDESVACFTSSSESIEQNQSEKEPGFAGLAGAFAKMSLEGSKSDKQIEFEEQMRKHAWESGHIDYLGKDSFDKIMKKIHASMAQADKSGEPSEKPAEPAPPTTTSDPIPTQATPTTKTEPEQVDEAVLAEERLAVEKKLAEQKKVAEQKLIEEKQAAEERAAAASQAVPASPEVAAPQASEQTESKPAEITAPSGPAPAAVATPAPSEPAPAPAAAEATTPAPSEPTPAPAAAEVTTPAPSEPTPAPAAAEATTPAPSEPTPAPAAAEVTTPAPSEPAPAPSAAEVTTPAPSEPAPAPAAAEVTTPAPSEPVPATAEVTTPAPSEPAPAPAAAEVTTPAPSDTSAASEPPTAPPRRQSKGK